MPFKVIFQGWDLYDRTPSHVLIKLPKTKLVNIMYGRRYPINKTKEMTSKELGKFYHSITDWNDTYETRNNSIVSRRIKAFFKSI